MFDLRKVRGARVESGYNQEEMAKLMGWSARAPYAKRESGLVDFSVQEFAKFLEITNKQEEVRNFFKFNVH
ncbi:MAG: helix-turn-helix domain-containing protein [Turicibacter sp.]|nr:helix-turn-helix domain-containing protein [Turicibacter sp.]